MNASRSPERRRSRLTLLEIFTAVGDFLMISIMLIILSIPLITAAPAAAAAMEARARIDPGTPTHPAREMFSAVRSRLRWSWHVGPLALLVGALSAVALAFWITVPTLLGVAMISLVLVIATCTLLLVLTLPTAMTGTESMRGAVAEAVRLAISSPLRSLLAVAASVAAAVLALTYPTFGVFLLGGALVEIAWRSWGGPQHVR